MKTGPMHRIVFSGVYLCGAKERDGERGTGVGKYVTCPKCNEVTQRKRAQAAARR